MKDFYYILGTDEKATSLEIKEAYRKLSKKFHPDLNFNDKYFEKHFREIKEAYDTLSNSDKRIAYDRKLSKFKTDPLYDQYAEDLKNKEEELRRREEKIRFRQAYPHYYRNSKAASGNSKNPIAPGSKSKTRKVDIGFTLVLILITLIFGNYVMKVVNESKKNTAANKQPVLMTAASIMPVKHKRKHKNLAELISSTHAPAAIPGFKPTVKVVADDYKSSVAETKAEAEANKNNANKVPVVDDNVQQADDNIPVQSTAVNYKTPSAKSPVLYATNIVSNVTGVTNMRKTDRYGSEVIKEIPTRTKVFVIEKGEVFYKVLCDNSTGYVPKWTLETK